MADTKRFGFSPTRTFSIEPRTVYLIRTFIDSDTTPSVFGGEYWKFDNSGATSITNFDNGLEGQIILVQFDGNTTLVDGNIKTNRTSTLTPDTTPKLDEVLSFIKVNNIWREIAGLPQTIDSNIKFKDEIELRFGDDDNLHLKIFHDTSNAIIRNNLGTLKVESQLEGGGVQILSRATGGVDHLMIRANADIGASLYFPGTEILRTVSDGVNLQGSGLVYKVNGDQVVKARLTAIGKLTDSTGGTTNGILVAVTVSTNPISVSLSDVDVTDNSGGTADGTIEAVSGSGADTAINNNFAEIAAKLAIINTEFGDLETEINGDINNNFDAITTALSDVNDNIAEINTKIALIIDRLGITTSGHGLTAD